MATMEGALDQPKKDEAMQQIVMEQPLAQEKPASEPVPQPAPQPVPQAQSAPKLRLPPLSRSYDSYFLPKGIAYDLTPEEELAVINRSAPNPGEKFK
jgi:hypothetical protein